MKTLLTTVLLGLVLIAPAAAGKDEWQGVGKIVVFGDLHGDYEQYVALLKQNQLVDETLNWQGGNTHLVQLGDIVDRGPDSLKIMRHLKELTKQAKRQKGQVHTLLGNHELMNLRGDLRYVHPGEYQALLTDRSESLQERYLARVFTQLARSDATKGQRKAEKLAELQRQYPLGYVEHSFLWAPKGEMYQWAKRQNSVIKINRTLFVHAGISPHQDLQPLSEINKRIKAAIRKNSNDELLGEHGPLWYRGLAQNEREVELEPLKAMLDYYDADTIVVAHTPTSGAIVPRFDARVVMADVGISKVYGRGQANLVIENGTMFAIHRGHKVLLPLIDEDVLDYLVLVSSYEPKPSRLTRSTKALSATVETE